MLSPSPTHVWRRASMRVGTWGRVVALAVAAGLAWVPFLGRALSPDEGGFLLVAAQWSPGTSLYGDYWVDRPPVLIGLFALADALGGAGALRALGLLAVVATVLLAALVGRLAVPGSARGVLLPAATAAVFVATPLFGGAVVNGELLGVPFVLAGAAAALAALAAGSAGRSGPALGWAVAAGAAAATAVLVKQNLLDVLVLVLALVLARWRAPGLLRVVGGFALGGLALTALVLGLADTRGTGPVELWRAVVVFRGEASAVITQSATGSTALRLGGLVLALVGSAAPLVAGVLAWLARGRPERRVGVDLRWPAYAVLAWEAVAVVLGGSYWLHYLMGLVPGLVLLAAAAAQRPRRLRRPHLGAYAVAAFSTLVVAGWVVVHPVDRPEAPVIAYLDQHARPGDTAVVAFGGANIVQAAGLRSPYPYLWSLPVRVRDPDLRELSRVLAGPERPTWLIVSGAALGSWGIDGARAAPYVSAEYALATHAGRFTVYHVSDAP